VRLASFGGASDKRFSMGCAMQRRSVKFGMACNQSIEDCFQVAIFIIAISR
jgi:hypothetical protein